MNDEQLKARLTQLLRQAGVSEDVYRQAYVRQQLRLLHKLANKQSRPIAVFPSSLLERAIRTGLDVLERTIERAVTVLFNR